MSNVIRPTFGSRPKTDTAVPRTSDPVGEHRPVRVFGQSAGYVVALIHDEHAQEGEVLKVVVGPLTGSEVEAVAILPCTPEGHADADVVGMAILRTLEIVDAAGRDPEIA